MNSQIPTEKDIRKMRDVIYGPSTDAGWEACRENWMQPDAIKWLQEHQPKKP